MLLLLVPITTTIIFSIPFPCWTLSPELPSSCWHQKIEWLGYRSSNVCFQQFTHSLTWNAPSTSQHSLSSAPPPGEIGIGNTPLLPRNSNVLESFEALRLLNSPHHKVSPAMTILRKYYGLKSSNVKSFAQGTEMAVYRTGSADSLCEGLLPKASPISCPPYHNYKSRNLANAFLPENDGLAEYMPLAEPGDGESEKPVRRRQKAEADFRASTPERLLKEENNSGSRDFSPVTGKGLAMRQKSASRSSLSSKSESVWLNSIPVGLGESIFSDGLAGVRKSSSTPSLQEQDNSNSPYVWPSSKEFET